MEFLELRNYAFLSQAAYRGLSGLTRGAPSQIVEQELASNAQLGIDNRFTASQSKLLTGSSTDTDSTDGFTFINQRPNTPTTGFSGTVFQSNGTQRFVIALRGTEPFSQFALGTGI